MGVTYEAIERPLLRARGRGLCSKRSLQQARGGSGSGSGAAGVHLTQRHSPRHFLYTCPDTHTCAPFPSSRLRKRTLDQGSFHKVHWGTEDTRKHASQKPAVLCCGSLWCPTPLAGSQGLSLMTRERWRWIPRNLPCSKYLQITWSWENLMEPFSPLPYLERGFPGHTQCHSLFKF